MTITTNLYLCRIYLEADNIQRHKNVSNNIYGHYIKEKLNDILFLKHENFFLKNIYKQINCKTSKVQLKVIKIQ